MLRVGVIGCGGMGKDRHQKTRQQDSGSWELQYQMIWRERKAGSSNLRGKGIYRCKRTDPGSGCGRGVHRISRICTCGIPFGGDQSRQEDLLWETTLYNCWGLSESSRGGSCIRKTSHPAWIHEKIRQRLHAGEGSPLIRWIRRAADPFTVHTGIRRLAPTIQLPWLFMIQRSMKLMYFTGLVDDEYESAQVIMPKVTKYSHSELKDPQIMLLRTKKGVCIDVEVFVNCKFGYDINCEVGLWRRRHQDAITDLPQYP